MLECASPLVPPPALLLRLAEPGHRHAHDLLGLLPIAGEYAASPPRAGPSRERRHRLVKPPPRDVDNGVVGVGAAAVGSGGTGVRRSCSLHRRGEAASCGSAAAAAAGAAAAACSAAAAAAAAVAAQALRSDAVAAGFGEAFGLARRVTSPAAAASPLSSQDLTCSNHCCSNCASLRRGAADGCTADEEEASPIAAPPELSFERLQRRLRLAGEDI